MIQLIYKNRLHIHGKISDVVFHINKLAAKKKTVREFLDQKAKNFDC